MEEEGPPPEVNITILNDDWKFIKLLNWTGVTLAAAPPYNFGIQKFENLKVYQYYALGLVAITIFGYLYSLIGRHFNVYPFMNLTTITMDVLSLTVLTTFNLIVICSSAFRTENINKLLTSLIKNDLFLQPKQKKGSRGRNELKFRINAATLSFGFAVAVIYDSYVWISVFGSQSLRFYFFKNFQYCIPIFVTLQFCECLKFLINRFKFSTKLLLNLVDEMHKFPKDDENVDGESMPQQWMRVSQKIKPRQEDIMQLNLLSKIFDTLFNSVETFNKIFEWQVLFLVFAAVIEVFQALNFLIAYGSGVLLGGKLANPFFAILRLLWTLLLLVLGLFVVNQSVKFREETRRLTMDIYKRLLEMPSDELLRDEAQEQLIVLNQQFMHRPLAVSGIFFRPDLEFIANTFLTITSLAPIIVQFNRI